MGGTSDRYQVSTIYTNLYDVIHSVRGAKCFSVFDAMSEATVMQWFDSFVHGYICICISTFSVHFNIPRPVFWFNECTDFIHDNICFRTWTANNAHIYKDHIRMLVYGIFWELFSPHSYKSWPTGLLFFAACVLLLLGQNNCPTTGPSSTRHTKKEVGIQWHLRVRNGPWHSTSLGLWLLEGLALTAWIGVCLVAGLSC